MNLSDFDKNIIFMFIFENQHFSKKNSLTFYFNDADVVQIYIVYASVEICYFPIVDYVVVMERS